MALPSSGTISLSDIQTEFGGANPIALSEYYKNGPYVTATDYAPNVPTSGPIALSNFYSARKLSLFTLTYTADGSFVLPGTFFGSVVINSMLGAGGGGGAGDGGPGYAGYPGGLITGGAIPANPGDTVQVLIGGGGGGGTYSSGGGAGGGGQTGALNWSTLEMLGIPGNFHPTNGAWTGFLNVYAVWNFGAEYPSFDQTVTINFPVSTLYTFTGSCDNFATIYLDGSPVLGIGGYETTYTTTGLVAAGNHTVRLLGTNAGGGGSNPAGIGLTITGAGFSGGNGGNAGSENESGAGGGGGGATLILLNNTLQAVAPGGGGGGGGGLQSAGRPNQNTPGNNGTYNGGVGQSKSGDGGGAGGGGGGFNGGAGGATFGGDDGAYSGENGAPLTPSGGSAGQGSNGGGSGSPGGSPGGAGGAGSVTVGYYA
jgi:hypothetical protein